MRTRRLTSRLVDLETLEGGVPVVDDQAQPNHRFSATMLLDLIRRLKPLDRQIILLYLEGEAAETIAEVTGLSAVNIATKIHRIKRILKQKYLEGAADARS